MHCVLSAISAEEGAQRIRCLRSRTLRVSRPNETAPGSYRIDADELHADDHIARDELLQVGEERLVLVLAVEHFRGLAAEPGHLQFVDREAAALDRTDDLAHLGVAIGLDHRKSALARTFKIAAGVDVTVVNNAQHAREDCDLRTNIEVFETYCRFFAALEELTIVLDIEHLDRLETGVEVETVGPDDISLLIVPLSLKCVLLVA